MKYLITGSNGFFGHYLVERLVADGHHCVLVGRTKPDKSAQNSTFFRADITDKSALVACRNAHPDIDAIIHLAALVPRTKSEDQAVPMSEVNVTGTCNLLEVFGDQIQSFVYASTAEVYGLPDAEGLISESTQAVPLSNYGASKLAGELFCGVFARHHNLPIPILRFTVLYGPGDRINRAIPNFINKALKGEGLEIFGGEELRDYLHVSDAAEATYLAATKPVNGVFNIGTGAGISIKETAAAIVKAIDPKLTMKVLPRVKKASNIVLDVRRAQDLLGFTAKHKFPDLIEEQIQWHKTN